MRKHPYTAAEIWFGSRFLEQLQAGKEAGLLTQWQVTYGRDPATDRDRAVLQFVIPDGPPSPRTLEITFDVESKLPISLKQWENAEGKGPADMVIDRITYFEALPDHLFEMQAPLGAKLIEE